jgi:hypothetical protein
MSRTRNLQELEQVINAAREKGSKEYFRTQNSLSEAEKNLLRASFEQEQEAKEKFERKLSADGFVN